VCVCVCVFITDTNDKRETHFSPSHETENMVQICRLFRRVPRTLPDDILIHNKYSVRMNFKFFLVLPRFHVELFFSKKKLETC